MSNQYFSDMKTFQDFCSRSRLASLLLLFAAALITGCISDKDKAWVELEEAVEEGNKTCPQNMGDGMTLTSLSIDDNVLEMKFGIDSDDEDVTPSVFRQYRQVFKTTMLQGLVGDADTRELLNLCVKAEVQMKVTLHFQGYSETVQIVIPINEIEEALNGDLSAADTDEDSVAVDEEVTADETEQALVSLRGQIPIMRNQLPMTIDEGTTWTDVSFDNANVTYIYSVDEAQLGGSVGEMLQSQQALLKNNIKVNMQNGDNTMKAFLQTCIQAGSGLIYRFVGDTSGESVSVRFSPSELSNL